MTGFHEIDFFTFGIILVGFQEIDFFTFGIILVGFLEIDFFTFGIILVGFHEIDFFTFGIISSSQWDIYFTWNRLKISNFYPSELITSGIGAIQAGCAPKH
jgi:hypothetical protein